MCKATATDAAIHVKAEGQTAAGEVKDTSRRPRTTSRTPGAVSALGRATIERIVPRLRRSVCRHPGVQVGTIWTKGAKRSRPIGTRVAGDALPRWRVPFRCFSRYSL